MDQPKLSDYLITALAPIIWGSTYLVTTELLPANSPLLAAVLRALPAGLILLLLGRTLPSGIWWWRAFVLGVLNIGAFFYFLFVAAYHLPGGIAALIMSFQPMIVLILGFIVLKERIGSHQILACVLGAAGIAMLVLQSKISLNMTGMLAGFAATICMATGIILSKHWGRPQSVSLLALTGWQLSVGGLVLLPIALLSEGLPNNITLLNGIGFTYLSLVGALFAYAIWFRGLERLPAITVSFISFASPLTACVLGFIFLNQSLSLMQGFGAIIIIAAIGLSQPKNHHNLNKTNRVQTKNNVINKKQLLQ
ncbi:EamA family transporter [Shewanella surugensis]|uniref:EamA family transporter n=1 Tax=Shewanella surugensis TaxID=212020 RepID=A0ABT0LES3_9GAMM|nr:EamA family transporter [Shewanella surugensis]MCL1126206.1 EamA family transporter [Shewanella surugensis]